MSALSIGSRKYHGGCDGRCFGSREVTDGRERRRKRRRRRSIWGLSGDGLYFAVFWHHLGVYYG